MQYVLQMIHQRKDKIIDDIMDMLKRYLRWVGFTILHKNPEYKGYHVGDFIVASAYYVISIRSVVMDEANSLVLFLNALCLIRAIIRNAMESSKITKRIKDSRNVNSIYTEKYHYFHKALVQMTVIALTIIVVILSSFDFKAGITKGFTIITIIFTFIDDIETIIIALFDAFIKPITITKEG